MALGVPLAFHPEARGQALDLAATERMIREGRPAEAYSILAQQENGLAGREDFDYLLGLAALESGRPDQATLVLERVLAVNPYHAAARLDMARAYFALGDDESAKAEFDKVALQSPPAAAQVIIDRYRKAMEARRHRGWFNVTGYAEIGAGRDTNVNNSTASSTLYVPLVGLALELSPSSMRRADNYLTMGAGAEVSTRLSPSWSVSGGLDARRRDYANASGLDFQSIDYRGATQYAWEANAISGVIARNDYDLDGAHFRKVQSMAVEWRRAIEGVGEVAAFLQDYRIRYTQSAATINSSNLALYGVNLSRALQAQQKTFLLAGVYSGQESATDGRPDGNRSLLGGRLGLQRAVRDGLDWFASTSLQKSVYSQFNPIFLAYRRDWQYDLSLGMIWRAGQNWTIRPQITHTRNDSTLTLNDYSRTDLSVNLRWDF